MLSLVLELPVESDGHHRTSIHKPDRGDDWALVEAHFNERNQADLSIYDFVQRAFEDQIQSLPAVDANSEKQFSGDRYDCFAGLCCTSRISNSI